MKLVAAVSVILAGCVPMVYVHPTKTQAEFAADKYQCTGEANAYATNVGAPGNPFIVVDRTRECLALRGWTQAPAKR